MASGRRDLERKSESSGEPSADDTSTTNKKQLSSSSYRSLGLAGVKSFSCEASRTVASLARENPDSSTSPLGRFQTQGISLPRDATVRAASHENDLKPFRPTGANQTVKG